jgi:uncharacterized protein
MTDSQAVAISLLEALKAKDKSKFRSLFLTPLSFLLTDYRVNSLFELTTFLLGPLQSWTPLETHRTTRLLTIYKTLATFQRGEQALTLSIWGNKATGVGIVNAMDVGLTPAWNAPSYIDESAVTEEEVSVRPYYLWPATKGTINIPKRSSSDTTSTKKYPTVLLIPGSGPVDRDCTLGGTKCMKDLALGLATAGFVTLRMDKPMPVVAFKQVLIKTATVQDEYITPLCAALKYLSAREDVDEDRIFLLGHSLGGFVAPRLCKEAMGMRVKVKGIVYCAAASRPIYRAMAEQLEYLDEHFPRESREVAEKEVKSWKEVRRVIESGGPKTGEKDPTQELAVPLPLSYVKDLWENDPVEEAQALDVPMLFAQGQRDWQVGIEDFERWQDGLKGQKADEKAEWKLYHNVGHTISPVDEKKFGTFQYSEPANVEKELIMDIIDFLGRTGTADEST